MSQSEDFAWAIIFGCMMADFQNGLISRIFRVFWSGFLQKTTVNDLKSGFCMFFFFILIFEPK